jgi:hypothetical protein
MREAGLAISVMGPFDNWLGWDPVKHFLASGEQSAELKDCPKGQMIERVRVYADIPDDEGSQKRSGKSPKTDNAMAPDSIIDYGQSSTMAPPGRPRPTHNDQSLDTLSSVLSSDEFLDVFAAQSWMTGLMELSGVLKFNTMGRVLGPVNVVVGITQQPPDTPVRLANTAAGTALSSWELGSMAAAGELAGGAAAAAAATTAAAVTAAAAVGVGAGSLVNAFLGAENRQTVGDYVYAAAFGHFPDDQRTSSATANDIGW